MNEVDETNEPQEETEQALLVDPYTNSLMLPRSQNCNFSQICADDIHCERVFELAACKFKCPVVCLKSVSSDLKIWVFVKLDDRVVRTYEAIPLGTKYCGDYSFTELLTYGLWQFINKESVQPELPFTTLYKVIIANIIAIMQDLGESRLSKCIIVPQGDMHFVPYTALLDELNQECFGEKCELTVIPSISFLQDMNRNKARSKALEVPSAEDSFLIVGNPTTPGLKPLPDGESEARSIANILRTVPVLGKQATKFTILCQIESAKIIHLAVHGRKSLTFSIEDEMEEQSYQVFAKEIEMLTLSADLVVLSCCVSVENPKEMVDAFIAAGAQCVISSLWTLGDTNACIFMQFLYQMLIIGLPSTQAFQRTVQFVRCLPGYFTSWGGLQHVGKTIKLHKNNDSLFPIQKLLGEVSIFPRSEVYEVECSVLKAIECSDVQVCCITFVSFYISIFSKILSY